MSKYLRTAWAITQGELASEGGGVIPDPTPTGIIYPQPSPERWVVNPNYSINDAHPDDKKWIQRMYDEQKVDRNRGGLSDSIKGTLQYTPRKIFCCTTNAMVGRAGGQYVEAGLHMALATGCPVPLEEAAELLGIFRKYVSGPNGPNGRLMFADDPRFIPATARTPYYASFNDKEDALALESILVAALFLAKNLTLYPQYGDLVQWCVDFVNNHYSPKWTERGRSLIQIDRVTHPSVSSALCGEIMKVLDGAKRWYDYTDFALDGLFDEFLDDDTNGNPTHLWRTITVRGTDQGTGGDKPDNLGTAHWGPYPGEVCRRTLVLALLGSPGFSTPRFLARMGNTVSFNLAVSGNNVNKAGKSTFTWWQKDVMNPNKSNNTENGFINNRYEGRFFSASRPNGMRMREFNPAQHSEGFGYIQGLGMSCMAPFINQATIDRNYAPVINDNGTLNSKATYAMAASRVTWQNWQRMGISFDPT